MNAELAAHPEELQRLYAVATPAARLRAIKQRLASAHGELGTTRLVTLVSAVEAMARSLVVHSAGRPTVELVEEVLRLRGARPGAEHFDRDDWELFEVGTLYRDLIVHECTSIGPDRHPHLIAATEAVLRGMIELAGLESGPKVVTSLVQPARA
jgi:hypothetical protein